MSHGRAIDPLPLEQFPLESDTQDPGFEQLFGSLVGDAATDADGFDVAVDEASAILDALDNALTLLGGQDGGDLDDAFSDILAVDPTDAGQHVVDLSVAIPDVQTNVDNLGNLLAGAGPPTPPGGGGGGGAAQCEGTEYFPANVALPDTHQVGFLNPTNVAWHITSKRLSDPTPGTFRVAETIPATMAPGQESFLSITHLKSAPLGYVASYTIVTDDPTSPHVLCLQVIAQIRPPSGGGGGGFGRGKGG